MRTTVIRPKGPGPFPLVVVNHGSTQNEIRRVAYRSPERDFEAIARWFVERGHVVAIPQRPGHGETGGPYLETQGGCDNADFRKAGLATAASIQAAIDYLTAQPFVRPDGVIIVGHSAGGWGALALASQNPRTVRAVINFSGGRGGRVDNRPDSNCAPDRRARPNRPHPDLVDLFGQRHVFSAGIVGPHGRGVSLGRRPRRVPHGGGVQAGGTFSGQLARRRRHLGASRRGIPRAESVRFYPSPLAGRVPRRGGWGCRHKAANVRDFQAGDARRTRHQTKPLYPRRPPHPSSLRSPTLPARGEG